MNRFNQEMAMSSANLTASQEKFGGQMSTGEVSFLRSVRDLLRAVIDARTPFFAALAYLLTDLREIRKHGSDADAAFASGWKPAIASAIVLTDAASTRAKPSDAERAFLEDIDGLIDYAMRNGVSFASVFSALTHDVGEVAAYGWSLEKAKADCFTPKVTGWAKKNTAAFGEAEIETE
jgi:hypothetical protein